MFTSQFTVKYSEQVRNLGVILDADLNFESHVNSIYRAAFYHLKNISRVSLHM